MDIVEELDGAEQRRLLALARYFDGQTDAPDPTLGRYAELAARVAGASAGYVNLVGKDRIWSKASFGDGLMQVSRAGAPCERVILAAGPGFSIPDALIEPAVPQSPPYAGLPFRAYAGVPLRSSEGDTLGTVCVLDREPRAFTPDLYQALQMIAQLVMEQLEARRAQTEALERLPEPALVCNGDWQVLSANAAATKTLLDGPLLAGSLLRTHLPYEVFRAIVASAREGAAPGPVEVSLRERRFAVCVHPTAAGRQLHFVDVTAEREELASLRRSHHLFESLVDGSRDAIFAKDLEGRYTLINPVGARYFRKPPDEILGRTDHELSPAPIADIRVARDRTALALGRTVIFEESEPGSHGTLTWSSSKGVLRDRDGKVFGIFGISRDLTERKRREEALALSEERLRLAMAAGALGAWDWDVQTRRLHASGETLQLLGLPDDATDSLARAFAERVPPAERKLLGQALEDAVERSVPLHREFPLRAPDGSVRWLRADGQPMRDGQGRIVRLVGVISDVTAARRREQELHGVARFQEQLLGIVSHDLRNPLSAIRAWTAVLTSGDGSERNVRRVGERILRSAARMEQMITALLDFTRARLGGGIPVYLAPANLHEICAEVVEELRAAHPGRIAFESEGDGAGVWDATRLGQVASNLIGNALQHSPPDSQVKVRTSGLDGWAQLEVTNAGEPIPPEMRDALFEPFRSGAEGSQGHLGLGLFIARETVLAHGGDIEVSSSAEEGTRFCVRLPR